MTEAFEKFRALHAGLESRSHQHNDHDPLHNAPIVKDDGAFYIIREMLRNWRLVSVEQVGKQYIYRTEHGQRFASFYPPDLIEFPRGNP